MPRFYPNLVTLAADAEAQAEQRANLDILAASHLPGRWAVKDSFAALDLARHGFDVLLEASWMRAVLPVDGPPGDIEWRREDKGSQKLPYDDPDFAWFTGRRGFRVVAGGMLYRAAGVVGVANVVAEAADAVAVWRSLIVLAAQAFPRLPLVGYEQGEELAAALDAGFEIGDPLRVWVRSPG
ncbi:MAG: hypothetical protein LCH95_13415 [Proteobacteria bacterium]|nr:hypothetical protein [Pseudomonadota bacterium]